jgi:transcriptional regulator with XRE-family HTH domain
MAVGLPSANLRARRVSASLTAEQLAQRSGLPLRAVLLAEHVAATRPGVGVLSASDQARLAAALATTVSDLRGS